MPRPFTPDNTGSWAQNASLAPVGTPAQFGASVALSASGEQHWSAIPTAQTYGTATVYDFNGSWSTGTPLTVTPNAETSGRQWRSRPTGPPPRSVTLNGGLSGGEVTVFSLDATTAATSLSASANPSSAIGRYADHLFGHHLDGKWNAHGHGHLQHRTPHAVHGERLG